MVDVKTESKTNNGSNAKPVNPRQAIREARQRRLKLITSGQGKATTIKVYPANDAMREVLRHPGRGIRFRDNLDQGVEWPNDSFTQRRIAEGSILTEPATSGEYVAPDKSLNPREQSAARKVQTTKQEKSEEKAEAERGSKPAPKSQTQPHSPAP